MGGSDRVKFVPTPSTFVTRSVELFPRGSTVCRWGKYFPLLLPTAFIACLELQRVNSSAILSINPGSASIVVGEAKDLTASIRNPEGQVLTRPIVWWSSENAVATVEPGGLVRGVGTGVATIHASADSLEAVATVQVTLIQVRPDAPKVMLTDTVRLSAVVGDNSGTLVSNPQIAWLSSDSTIASIDSTGLVTGRSTGTVSIVAVAQDKVAMAQLVVTPWTLVGAGDIADCASGDKPPAGLEATAGLLDSIPGVVFTLGDNAYPSGTAQQFAICYHPTWGRHRSRTRPTPGNHDYLTPGAAGYFAYFGPAAGDSAKGYYSYDLGSWHIVAVNSVIATGPSSAQVAWLRNDLASHPAMCTLAYWHYSLFSSGIYAVPGMRTTWQALYDAGADVVLSGHDHFYERFGPQSPDGVLDSARGIREFVVGTGGDEHQAFLTVAPNSEVRNNKTFGVLKLSLYADRYRWEFIPTAGGTFSDSGSALCH